MTQLAEFISSTSGKKYQVIEGKDGVLYCNLSCLGIQHLYKHE